MTPNITANFAESCAYFVSSAEQLALLTEQWASLADTALGPSAPLSTKIRTGAELIRKASMLAREAFVLMATDTPSH